MSFKYYLVEKIECYEVSETKLFADKEQAEKYVKEQTTPNYELKLMCNGNVVEKFKIETREPTQNQIKEMLKRLITKISCNELDYKQVYRNHLTFQVVNLNDVRFDITEIPLEDLL